ncbi:hypothetical protein HELRODRAFT_116156 [Helobdella robusta]|uniref:DNA (cytosine-5)-methyltransferase n=1 Tax=Helobdella robusta TaxID=6412 RepID=T1EGD4_HELRO|nr:hypothetical protein HELRODRAFT_116156 [Helobdella robusta]ESN92163.1 hypothetical protein HELRODRAFT_116156 [Helobdella robusta]
MSMFANQASLKENSPVNNKKRKSLNDNVNRNNKISSSSANDNESEASDEKVIDELVEQAEKKMKLDSENKDKSETDITNKELMTTNTTEQLQLINHPKNKFIIERCTECGQILDEQEIVMYPGDSGEAVEEFVALTDSRLSLFTGDEQEIDEADERPQHRLTNFSVYDRMTHLCPFDSGLLEKNVELYFSGYIKPIYDDNPSIEAGGICTRNMGPINQWWTAGFDGGEVPVVGFSTAFAEYILLSPSDAYKPFWDAVSDKTQLSKVVIEFLKESIEKDEQPSYEDLVNRIQVSDRFFLSSNRFTEDSLLQHAQFIIDQLQSYDDTADTEDVLLIIQPCIRTLVKLTGVTLGRKNKSFGNTQQTNRKTRQQQQIAAKTAQKKKDSKATVTPLVREVFDSLFKGQIEGQSSAATKRRRCGVCEACQMPDCGKCRSCMDMIKFGGSGRSKQACLIRRCPYMSIKEAEDDDLLDDNSGEIIKGKKRKMNHNKNSEKTEAVTWIGSPLATKYANGEKIFYLGAYIGEHIVKIGDHVCVRPDDPAVPMYVAQVRSMWQEVVKRNNSYGKAMFHARWLNRGGDTVLGETSDPKELFLVDECQDSPLHFIAYPIKVDYVIQSEMDFFGSGGGASHIPGYQTQSGLGCGDNKGSSDNNDDGKSFFCRLSYDQSKARFEDFSEFDSLDVVKNFLNTCASVNEKSISETPFLDDEVGVDELLTKFNYTTSTFNKNGNGKFLEFMTTITSSLKILNNRVIKYDEDVYPELYRKTEYIKGSNEQVPEPFRIALVVGFFVKTESNSRKVKVEEVNVVVQKFYRPENTNRGLVWFGNPSSHKDLNLLYWSEDRLTVSFRNYTGKCTVTFFDESDLGLQATDVLTRYFNDGSDRFYFTEMYLPDSKSLQDVPSSQIVKELAFYKGGGKGKGKSKNKSSLAKQENVSTDEKKPLRALKCLDVFAGCGGLSEGLHQAGIADTRWAIEKDESASQAFRLNNPSCTVFSDDCNELLSLAISGSEFNSTGQRLPKRGDVELLCGGPPCQGFSGMNRFNQREYSKFKNSLIASYLSYCDYYRPKYFLLENVRNFVSFKRGVVLKLALRCLISMGYQCTFGVLQAGCYGIPQTRRRAIILASAPGYKLPFYPEPMHSFSVRGMQLTVAVDGRRFESCVSRTSGSAPFRTITVRDAMSDLPEVNNGAGHIETGYGGEPVSHFQKMSRRKIGENSYTTLLQDHVCKEMSALVLARMQHIPLAPGSDWRDLPNLEIRLKDGTVTRKLRYTHDDKRVGKTASGNLRGVCSCVETGHCDPAHRQFNTLIPWCLPHTGNRHNHWSGLYGRLEWDGFFSTTVTNPEPMGKQGRVLHPEQHRVVTVRECARSQGFPDTYRFYGTVLDRHRQVGNAVPPPMARHIGFEIKKSLQLSLEKKENDKKP